MSKIYMTQEERERFDKIKALVSVKQRPSGNRIFLPGRQAGMNVNHDTALTFSAIWRAINLISGAIGVLPWSVYQRQVVNNGINREKLWTHPAMSVLGLRANDEMSTQTWIETTVAWALTWGNAYSEIERDASNRPVALWPIAPERVTPDRDGAGNIIYKVSNSGRESTTLPAKDVFHLHGLGYDGLTGYSVIGYAARAIGLGLATEQFGSSFFENGATVSGIFEHPDKLGDDAIKHLRESLMEAHGGPYNSNKPLILEEGMKYNTISIPPDDAQFIQTRKFSVVEIARWYGIPPHKLMEMEQATFSNIEHQAIEFVQDSLMPWIKRLETEADLKLISPANRNRVYTKINVNALLRGDLATRKEWYKTMMNLGVYSVNEVRDKEDDNPIGPEGDKRLVQMNQTTLEKIGEEPEPAPEPPTQEPPPDEEDDTEEEPPPDEETDNEEAMDMATLLERLQRAESIIDRLSDTIDPGPMIYDTPQYKVLEETFARIRSREYQRSRDALNRYNDRGDLFEWMNKFYSEHKNYMKRNLETPLAAVTKTSDLEGYIQDHVQLSRLTILTAFDNSSTEPDFISAEENAQALVGGKL